MALTLDGNGTMTVGNGDITGITRGAIESTAIGAGAVLQVVSNDTVAAFSTASTSMVSTGITGSITPTNTSSKILVFVNLGSVYNASTSGQPRWTLYRGATDLASTNGRGLGQIYSASGAMQAHGTGILLDSPATTSATTYTVYVKLNLGTLQWGSDGGAQVMILMEIAA